MEELGKVCVIVRIGCGVSVKFVFGRSGWVRFFIVCMFFCVFGRVIEDGVFCVWWVVVVWVL